MKCQGVPRTRREFLAGLAGAALAPVEARTSIYNPKLAVQTYVWLLELESKKVPLRDGLETVFSGIRRAGYARVELMPAFLVPDLRTTTLRLLKRHGLEPSIVYVSGELHESAAAEQCRARVLEMARAMKDAGAHSVNFSPRGKPAGQPKTDGELETQAYQLNRMGEELRTAGLDLLLHHHTAEMDNGAREWRYSVAHTETKLVTFCLDVDWAARAGIDPLVLIDEAGGRLRSLHLRNRRNGVLTEELADGDIEMSRVARYLRESFYDGYLVVELVYDKNTRRMHTLPMALSHSRRYMQEVFAERPGALPADMGPHVMTRRT